uniref:PurE domain-containing protein n=1 Tax=Bos indicus x Bos taurus TaxID=30522 RepID=A0A4W2CFG6_BOBOX
MAAVEGKTKGVCELLDSPGKVLLQSKDQITAGNAARKNHLEGKAAISNKITSCIFQLLQEAGDGIPTVFVAVAGRSNGLGPVLYGNTAYPVISCPPPTPDWGAQDVWSSLQLPVVLAVQPSFLQKDQLSLLLRYLD